MEGYLEKCSDFLSRWNSRYFVVEESRFIAFKHKGSSPQRIVRLQDCLLRDDMTIDNQVGFSVFIPSLQRWHIFRCKDKETKYQWLVALRSAIDTPYATSSHQNTPRHPSLHMALTTPSTLQCPSRTSSYERKRFSPWISTLFDEHKSDADWILQTPTTRATRTFHQQQSVARKTDFSHVVMVGAIFTLLVGVALINLASPTLTGLLIVCVLSMFTTCSRSMLPRYIATFFRLISDTAFSKIADFFSQHSKTIITVAASADTVFGLLLDMKHRNNWDCELTSVRLERILSCNKRVIKLEYSDGSQLLVEQHHYRLRNHCFVIGERCLCKNNENSLSSVVVIKMLSANATVITRVLHKRPTCWSHIVYPKRIDHELFGVQALLESLNADEAKHIALSSTIERLPVAFDIGTSESVQRKLPAQSQPIDVEALIARAESGIAVMVKRNNAVPWVLIKIQNNVEVFSADIGSAMPIIKGVIKIHFQLLHILLLLTDLKSKSELDNMFAEGKIIEDWSSQRIQIMQQIFKAVWPTSARDFVNLGYWRYLSPHRAVIYACSVEHDACPPSQPNVRGDIVHAGFIIDEDEDDSSCKVTYLAESNLGGNVPKSIQKMVASQQPLQLDVLRQMLQKRQDSNLLPALDSEDLKHFVYDTNENVDTVDVATKQVFNEDGDVSGGGVSVDASASAGALVALTPPASPSHFESCKINSLRHLEEAEAGFDRFIQLARSQRRWSTTRHSKRDLDVFESRRNGAIKITAVINVSSRDIFAIVANSSRQHWFDSRIVQVQEINIIDEHTKVLFVSLQCDSLATIQFDAIICLQWHILDDGSIAISACSSKSTFPSNTNTNKQLNVQTSGWLIQQKSNQSGVICTVTRVLQVSYEGVNVQQGHIEGLNDTLANSFDYDRLERREVMSVEYLQKLFV